MSTAAARAQAVRNGPAGGSERGLKATEIGVFPEDWDVKPFGDLAYIERGKFSARPRNDPRYYGGDTPFIQTGDVTKSRGLITDYTQTLNEAGRSVSRVFPKGTLFFTIAANIGDIAFAKFDAACPDSLVGIRAKGGVNISWLAHTLRSRKASFESIATQNAQLNINLEKLRPYLLPVPPEAEQDAIGTVLDDADALIESLEQLIAKKRTIKQGAMQELLTGKRRLPSFNKEWKRTTLGELLTFKNGLNKSKRYFGYGTPIVNYMDVFSNCQLYTNRVEGRVSLDASERANFDVRRGDILFTRTSETQEEIGMACAVLDDPCDTVFSGFVLRGRPRVDGLLAEFAGYYLRSADVRSQIIAKASYTTRALTNGKILSGVKITLPDLDEQMAISGVLTDMEVEINSLEGKLAKIRQIKQGMMQELLTGRVRLL